MKSARTVWSVLALVVVLTGTATLPAFAAASHPVCAAKQHECGKVLSIRPCCCGGQHNAQDQPGSTTARVTFTTTLAPVAAIVPVDITVDVGRAHARALASPPRAAPVDLPTLFAALLI